MGTKTNINWIKWQVKHRMPGGDLFKCALNNNHDGHELEYYMYLHDLHQNPLLRYLLGLSLSDNQKQDKFYNYIDDYREKENDYYTFLIDGKNVNLPIPDYQDRKIYRTELIDLILPYLMGYPRNDKLPLHEGPYEYGMVGLEEESVVFDLGANFGMFSAFASSKGCKVHAFEPTIKTIDKYLSRTSQINPNIIVNDIAVSNEDGTQEFTIDKKDCRCNGISKTKTNLLKHEESKILIPTTTIDTYVDKNNIKMVDFIKADIEGAERLMLEGAKKTLREYEPDLSIFYYHLLDDYNVLTNLILNANPNYVIEHKWKKIYAYSKKKHK